MSDITTICTVRHGQTDYTVQKRYAGTIDVPLNKTGIEDTKRASRNLAKMRFDVVLTSTLNRAIDTARLLLGSSANFVQHQSFNERDYGKMQGLTSEAVKLLDPPINFMEAGGDYHSLNPPEGETFEMLRKRAESMYHIILEEYKGLTLLVVSHGVFLQQFHGLIRGLDWKQSLVKNVQNLEFNKFIVRGSQLLSESTIQLIEGNQVDW